VIPISILKVVTSAAYQKKNIYVDVAILLKKRVAKLIRVYRTRKIKILLYRSTIRKKLTQAEKTPEPLPHPYTGSP
jgi:hypothetical protein